MKRWYVVHTQPGSEILAQGQLENQYFRTYFPRFLKTTRHARSEKRVISPLFPRYVFVEIDMQHQRWRSINGTRGVSYLLSMGERPSAVPNGVVEEITARESDDRLIQIHEKTPHHTGEIVEITSGALTDQVGSFLRMDKQKRVVMLLEFLGRNVEVRLPPETVRTCA
jgi:transcriptional antiterminator RfaH